MKTKETRTGVEFRLLPRIFHLGDISYRCELTTRKNINISIEFYW